MLAINGRFLTQRITGVQRFAREILPELIHQRGSALEVLTPPTDFILDPPLCPTLIRSAGKFDGHLWEQFDLPGAACNKVLLNLCNSAPILMRRQVVVLHDASVAAMPDNYTFAYRAWYRMIIASYLRSAAKIVTVSAFSAGEIQRFFGARAASIEVVPESGEHILRTPPDNTILQRLKVEKDGFFLAVSSLAPHKNFAAVVQAVAQLPQLPFKFIVVGGRNSAVFNVDSGQIRGAIEAGYVSDGELRALYENAACFVYPSLYEGFGLPPLEAMSCGCPVVVSQTASLPEVCGDAAVYCDPSDSRDIARALDKVLGSKSARDELRQAGLSRAAEWTWRRAAAQMDAVVKEVERR